MAHSHGRVHFLIIAKLSSKAAVYESSSCSILSAALGVVGLCYFSHLESDIVASFHDCNFPSDYHVLLWCLYVFFGQVAIKIFWSLSYIRLFYLVWLNFESYLYILDTNPVSEVWLANTPFLSVVVFCLSLWCFEGKFLILMKSNLSTLSFIDLCLIHAYKVFSMLPSRSFIGLGFIFRSMIHFE